jgi:hypothetical protein
LDVGVGVGVGELEILFVVAVEEGDIGGFVRLFRGFVSGSRVWRLLIALSACEVF